VHAIGGAGRLCGVLLCLAALCCLLLSASAPAAFATWVCLLMLSFLGLPGLALLRNSLK